MTFLVFGSIPNILTMYGKFSSGLVRDIREWVREREKEVYIGELMRWSIKRSTEHIEKRDGPLAILQDMREILSESIKRM